MKIKEITIEEYNKKMDAIIKRGLPVEEALILMLDEAGKYRIRRD